MERLIQKILTEENSIVDAYLSEEEKKEYLDIVSKIKVERLYKSKIHGIYHSEKVCLFAFIIAKGLNLNEVDMQIIIDAALYHDIGRQNDSNDTIHGFSSAYLIDSVIDSDIYKDANNLKTLKAIIDSHSVNDNKSDKSFSYYFEVFDEEKFKNHPMYSRFELLNKVLKDADGLDRNRFVDGYCFGLDERFLRLPQSKKLINLSREINDIYSDNYVKDVNIANVKGKKNTCLHGIGLDFFKMRSILENGILSASELRTRKIEGVKNFNGGNARNWISVVDESLVARKLSGYETFIKKGISFICSEQFLVDPLPFSERSIAMEKGLPYNKSDHEDERYVYKVIDPSDIKGIFLTEEIANKKIDEGFFLFNCLDYRTFLSRISHYIDSTNANVLGYNQEQLEQYLLDYKVELDKYNDCKFANDTYDCQKLVINLTRKLNMINELIKQMIKKYYCSEIKMNPDDITVRDIVAFELSKAGKDFIIQTADGNVRFTPNSKVKNLVSSQH